MRFPACLPVFLCLVATARAHVVPNMTIEADFAKDSGYTLRINLDPRVFLSDQPTSLPPVSAGWYLEQTDSQKTATHEKATEYLRANVGLTFGGRTVPLPPCEYAALDGADNEPLKPDTAETHLLATARANVPEGADSFQIVFGRAANVSLILVNSEEGDDERKPQVIFPGESSRPFKLPPPALPNKKEIEVTQVTVTRVYPEAPKILAVIGAGVAVLFIAGVLFIRRTRR